MQKEIHLNETEWKKFTNVEKKIWQKFFLRLLLYSPSGYQGFIYWGY